MGKEDTVKEEELMRLLQKMYVRNLIEQATNPKYNQFGNFGMPQYNGNSGYMPMPTFNGNTGLFPMGTIDEKVFREVIEKQTKNSDGKKQSSYDPKKAKGGNEKESEKGYMLVNPTIIYQFNPNTTVNGDRAPLEGQNLRYIVVSDSAYKEAMKSDNPLEALGIGYANQPYNKEGSSYQGGRAKGRPNIKGEYSGSRLNPSKSAYKGK